MLAPEIIDAPGLPETQELLIEGGDERIGLDAGRNAYGCAPYPDPDLAQFGSSTASTVSWQGFESADALRQKIIDRPDAVTCRSEFSRIRREFLKLCGLSDLEGLELLFCASGTDAHHIASGLVKPDFTLMVEESETGKGVPAAFSTRYSHLRPLDRSVRRNLSAGERAPVHQLCIRNPDGSPRDGDDIDREASMRVESWVRSGGRVLLVPVDVSKTGMIAPSPSCAFDLKARFPAAVEVLIDACQFRMAPGTLRTYLERGCLVAVTGSKFLTGPAFSGALLVPGNFDPAPARHGFSAKRIRAADLMFGSTDGFGLLMRWEAALAELRAFSRICSSRVERFLKRFAGAVQRRLAEDPHFEPVAVPPLDRPNPGWDCIQTIFPFLLRKNGREIGRTEVVRLHALLREDLSHVSGHDAASLRCSLGQPVSCGSRSALRLCSSARLVVDGDRQGDAVNRRALLALDKVALLLDLL